MSTVWSALDVSVSPLKGNFFSDIISETIKPKSSRDEFQDTFEWLISPESGFTPSGLMMKRGKSNNWGGEEGINETFEWLKTVMKYNVPGGKQIRGRMVEYAYKQLVPDASEEDLKLSRILGWCVEIIQAASLVADDIMDQGVTRRGKLCWHRVNDMGNIAVNDAFLLEHVALQLARKYFGNHECYTELLNLILGVAFITILGQSLDTTVSLEQDYDQYTASNYNSIVTYKTGYYTIYIPLAVAIIFAGISSNKQENKQLWEDVEDATLIIGKLFQIQDDYLDCFGDEKKLGKCGTDIQEGKCTWLFVTAKEYCTKEEYKILKQNYGSSDEDKISKVKKLYTKLGLPDLYLECQDKLYDDVIRLIEKMKLPKVKNIFYEFLGKVYNRMY